MKVILVSDSHGKDDALEMILKQYPDADAYVHCGDIETYPECFPQFVTVRGNNDVFYEYPELNLRGYVLTLRLQDANKIEVEREEVA